MIKKKFSKTLHAAYDQPAKDAFNAYMESKFPEAIVVENPFGKYGVDFQITGKDKDTIYLDTEVRPAWVTEKFPYNTVHLPSRKLKFANKFDNAYFLSLNKELTRALLFKINKTDTMVMVNNKYVATGEKFVNIPISRCKYIDLA